MHINQNLLKESFWKLYHHFRSDWSYSTHIDQINNSVATEVRLGWWVLWRNQRSLGNNLRETNEVVNVYVDHRFECSSDEDLIVCQELHGFSDVTKSGFGACVYVHSFCRSGKVTVRLLAAKSRAPPLKTETIPRLELLRNLLLSRPITSVKYVLKNCDNFDKIYLCADSK